MCIVDAPVSYTHLRAHETEADLVCRLLLEKKGLIHQVPDKNNLKKYSLCNLDSCSPDSHNHQHGHFICYSCDQTFCLDDFTIKILKTSSGHIVKNYNLILEGYCTDCNSSQTISQN